MPAGFGREEMPIGRYLGQIRDVESVEGTDFNDKSKVKEQFKWGVDYQLPNGKWRSETVFTGRVFSDLKNVKDPQFVTKLTRFIRATGTPLPTSAAEARAWDENGMVGKQYGLIVYEDEETGIIQQKFVTVDKLTPAAADPFDGDAGAEGSPQPVLAGTSTTKGKGKGTASPLAAWDQ